MTQTYSSKVAVSLDGDGELPMPALLVVYDGPEPLNELSKDSCAHFVILVSIFRDEE